MSEPKNAEVLTEVSINGMKALVDENNGVAKLQCGEFEAVQHNPENRPVLVTECAKLIERSV